MISRNIIFPIILMFTLILFLFNDMGIIKWYQLRKERDEIQNNINKLINEEKKITEEIIRLETNDEYIKKIAREKFHMVKRGEKVFRIVDRRKIKTN